MAPDRAPATSDSGLVPVYDVAVVGLGPVGAVAAQLLAREGLRVGCVEQGLTPYDRPRAIGIDHESLRVLQPICDTQILAGILGPYRVSEYRSQRGEVLRRIVPQPEPFPLGWPPYNTFVQPELEQLLRDGFSRWATLEPLLGWWCEAIATADSIPVLTVKHLASGERREVRSRFVIACDGARSPIREQLGLSLEDLAFDEPWLVVDVLVDDTAVLPEATTQFCDPDRPCTFIAGPRNLRRWEIMLLPGESPDDMVREETIWRLLRRWLTPGQATIWRAATYRFHALVCERWRRGNVFIAGDAAHQTPPFMAQGLNQGIRDAANLCWKIARCVKQGAPDALLESYDTERRPNARAVIELTKSFGRLICERDPAAAAERDLRLLGEMRRGEGEFVRQSLLPPLKGGFLAHDGEGEHRRGVGAVFPQPWVGSKSAPRRMDDVVGTGFRMFFGSVGAPAAAVAELATAMDIVLVCTSRGPGIAGAVVIEDDAGLIDDWLRKHGATAALVRPDHVVFGVTHAGEDVLDLLHRLQRGLQHGRVDAGPLPSQPYASVS